MSYQHSNKSQRQRKIRLDEDADRLVVEAFRFFEAGEQELVHALMTGTPDELVRAAEHCLVCNGRARRFISIALHFDAEAA